MSPVPLITLTTDMGDRDYYVSAVKGTLYRLLPGVTVVDITHHIPPFDIAQASFVLRNAYRHFPQGSIHLIGVNPEAIKRKSPFDMREEVLHVVVEKDGHYFIGADNGIFSLLFDTPPDRVFEITVDTGADSAVFPARSVFAPVACMLASGAPLEEIGLPLESLRERATFRPVVEADMLKGTIIYIDTYGNVIANITRDLFEQVRRNRNFTIYFRREDYEITEISQTYGDVPEGEKVGLFNASGHLEIAINRGVEGSGGGASSLFGLKLNDTIRIEFHG